MSDLEVPTLGCEHDSCGQATEAFCSFHLDPLAKRLCRHHSHVMSSHQIACPDCFVNLGAPV
jgi:hypothetical protein